MLTLRQSNPISGTFNVRLHLASQCLSHHGSRFGDFIQQQSTDNHTLDLGSSLVNLENHNNTVRIYIMNRFMLRLPERSLRLLKPGFDLYII